MNNIDAVMVAGTLPATPLMVIDSVFMVELSEREQAVASLSIKDAASAKVASALLSSLTGAGTKLEAERKRVKEPFKAICDAIDAAPKPIQLRIEAAKSAVRTKLNVHIEAEQKKAAELERQRQSEIARLEKLKREEDERAAKEAAELAKHATVVIEDEPDFDEPAPKSEVEKQLDAVKFAPVAVAAKPQGVTFRCTLRIASVQVSALPDNFVLRTADEGAIRRLYCVGWKEGQPLPVVPGVTFSIDRMPVSRGEVI